MMTASSDDIFYLVNRGDICKLVSNNDLKIMIISADHWLSLLP